MECSKATLNNCQVYSKQQGDKRYDTYETKVGSLTEEYTYSPDANSWFLTGHPVKTEEDFKVLQYMVENTVITDTVKEFEEEYKKVERTVCACLSSDFTARQLFSPW